MIEVRSLSRQDDSADLIALSQDFFKEYEAYHRDFLKIDRLTGQDITHYFASFCDQAARRAFIAVDGARIVGYITVYVYEQPHYWQVKKVGEISGLMVHEEYRKQGIAQKLLDQALEFFASESVRYFTVFTSVNNQLGLGFYQRNGLIPLYTTMLGEVSL